MSKIRVTEKNAGVIEKKENDDMLEKIKLSSSALFRFTHYKKAAICLHISQYILFQFSDAYFSENCFVFFLIFFFCWFIYKMDMSENWENIRRHECSWEVKMDLVIKIQWEYVCAVSKQNDFKLLLFLLLFQR